VRGALCAPVVAFMVFARKRFGQHFLEPAWVEKVIRAIDPKPDELFIEIGPGRGALTRPLAARAKAVTAFEIDRDLAAHLQAAAIPNLTVVEGDFLAESPNLEPRTLNPEPRTPNPIRVAGNLPYNVASPILFKLVQQYRIFTANGLPFGDATVMLQREVADRLIASPGTKEYGGLSILIQHNANVEMLLKLPPGAFRPAPKVQSALVRLRFHPPDPPVNDAATLEALVQAVFTRRRKTLANALLAYGGRQSAPAGRLRSPNSALAAAGLDGRRRPETLTVAEFARLADVYAG
jgi:16S rRNA (adenine1518-N6/adenine1519-N6)-dimethyltransferase